MEILGGFLLGLVGSLHCVGMCGPIVLAVSSSRKSGPAFLRNIIYHSGRWVTYALLGVLFGMIGKGLEMLLYQQAIAIITGILVLLWAVAYYFPLFRNPGSGIFSFFSKKAGPLLASNSAGNKFFLGFINGFLPCGLVYLAATTSILLSSPIESAAYMIMFGIGTTPALLALVTGKSLLNTRLNININRWIPGIAGVMGLILIIRGLGLGIPYLSPRIELPAKDGKKVESCCTEQVEN